MITQKAFSHFITFALAVGIAFAIYDSYRKQNNIQTEKTDTPSKLQQIALPTAQPDTKKVPNVIRSDDSYISDYSLKEREIPQKPRNTVVSVATPESIFKGKLSGNSALHAIGIYQGEAKSGKDKAPWWSHCMDKKDDPRALAKCRDKYSETNRRQTVSVKVGYTKKPIVLALMAYEPVLWSIDQYSDVKLEGVILGGYHAQEIIGISSGTPVISFTYDTPSCESCTRGEGYFYAYKRDEKFSRAVEKLSETTGKSVSSFQTVYKANKFYLNNNSD